MGFGNAGENAGPRSDRWSRYLMPKSTTPHSKFNTHYHATIPPNLEIGPTGIDYWRLFTNITTYWVTKRNTLCLTIRYSELWSSIIRIHDETHCHAESWPSYLQMDNIIPLPSSSSKRSPRRLRSETSQTSNAGDSTTTRWTARHDSNFGRIS